ncbi:hypothetical protein SAMN05660463_00847 [Pseudomonas sp. URIL14HWK12:I9]|nr:hypothetical protein F474_00557 [Pseudomonas sp. URIL14HWK12:I12]PVZ27032.1 hypothetical protein F470_00212 [Pseudomonas sp. URIL14HWK12:I10]PVZ37921.1 hypothetical protein F472_00557 [Pseudomonas sp. URIL14HWK12:I11]SNZ05135.1 hypothetical protein SAMN05660463_00847 [Pseudomonas sp. URIL14HWK12:I9]
MKPRIEKKLSHRLVRIFEGTRVFDSVWIDDEYYRHPLFSWGEALTPSQIRFNKECNVKVNHVPSVGGEPDYWGEGTDHFTVLSAYRDRVWSEILYTDRLCKLDCKWPRPEEGTAEFEEWQAEKNALLDQARRAYRRQRPGNRLMAHARGEAASVRASEAEEARKRAERRASR